MTLDLILDAIVNERQYQARRWGTRHGLNRFEETQRSVPDFLVYMKTYLDDAFRSATTEVGDDKALEALRKVVALGVACFEQHGMPVRDPNTRCVNARDGMVA